MCLLWETSFKTHMDTVRFTGVLHPTARPFTGNQWQCPTGPHLAPGNAFMQTDPLLANPIGRNRSTNCAANSVILQTQIRTVGRYLVNQPVTPQPGGTYLWGFTSETLMSNLR